MKGVCTKVKRDCFGSLFLNSFRSSGPNQWPAESDLPNFKQGMNTLFEKYHALSIALNDHICNMLELPTSAISSYIPVDIAFQSGLWHHSPPVKSQIDNETAEAQGYHDLDSFITLMIQSRPGLQARNRDGKWVEIPYIPGSIICTIGTCLTP